MYNRYPTCTCIHSECFYVFTVTDEITMHVNIIFVCKHVFNASSTSFTCVCLINSFGAIFSKGEAVHKNPYFLAQFKP